MLTGIHVGFFVMLTKTASVVEGLIQPKLSLTRNILHFNFVTSTCVPSRSNAPGCLFVTKTSTKLVSSFGYRTGTSQASRLNP
ncbi:hypothetical protein PF008_g21323 [Phytophthora fragariae]|uniref:Secreted protein n=1 Tax=Phytophthora fragariae TaxID=53985 RepID=A0A6G0QX64_9STRA|nr:hypothetical protein PF008_g21323 [Phytophthora fragariae]